MNKLENKKIYTVSELNRDIKAILETAYPEVWLEGEITDFKTYSSGHMYFGLKDRDARISAVIFHGSGRAFKFKPEDGLKVIACGRISTYPKSGVYQIIVGYLEPAGKGALQLAFEQLKEKLEKEGLFDQARKKPIPVLPQKIGVVTSPTGAAIRDIISVINRRFANVEILLYPVKVQGDEAKEEIAQAIGYLNEHYPELDVLLVGRGGGSYEDLWAFNEEIVARAIAASNIPVISCVGHEIDFTIADFVADLRAATPSAAAELVVKDKSELSGKLDNLDRSLLNRMNNLVSYYEENIGRLSASRALTLPEEIFEDRLQEIDDMLNRLSLSGKTMLEFKHRDWEQLSGKLNLLSPLNTLDRGYAICRKAPENTIVRSSSAVKAGDNITVKLAKGEIEGKITAVN